MPCWAFCWVWRCWSSKGYIFNFKKPYILFLPCLSVFIRGCLRLSGLYMKSKIKNQKSKIIIFFIAVFLFVALPFYLHAFEWRQVENKAFGVGESIVFVIKYGFVPAGTASLEVQSIEEVNGRPVYNILSKARSNKAIGMIFKVRDKNESWMDVESLCSLRFYQWLHEGLYKREVRVDYDQPQGRFLYWKKRKGKETTKEGGAPVFVQDVLSSLYYVRTQDMKVGEDITFDANSGSKTWPLIVRVKKVETVSVPGGRFECLRIEPFMEGQGVFKSEGNLEVWVTNDERKVPVLLRSRVMIGAFDAEMVEYVPGEIKSKVNTIEENSKFKSQNPK